ncbi:MAG: glycosyl hydrolase 53 family protein [Bacteroidota bacterium]
MFFIFISCKKAGNSPNPAPPVPVTKVFYTADKFVMGADLSSVNAVQDNGGVYKDSGLVKDPFIIFKNHGANTVRVRLWNNPQWLAAYNNGKLYSGLNDVEKTIQRAKAEGMAVNLDLHYSDEWADPGDQTIPAAWSNLSLNVLKDSVYQFTLNILNELKAKNSIPEFIQVGNETNQGMLFPTGKVVNDDWTAFGTLLKSGIQAIRDFSATTAVKPQIILHVAEPENANYFANGVINKAGITDFDILGISYYYVWSNVTSLSGISTTISSLKSKYNKKIMVVEAAYPWTAQYADSYTNVISGTTAFAAYDVSKDGQYKYMKDLTQQVIAGGGAGIMYWEPAWISSNFRDKWGTGSSWENNTFFDFSGNTLPGIDFMNYAYQF